VDPAVQESAPVVQVAPPPPAATDIYPRDQRERDLCKKASSPDWLYLAIPPVLVAGAIALDSQGLKYQESSVVRMIGPATVGLTWGFMFGGSYLALPKCSPTYVSTIPPEGDVRPTWPVALAIAMFAGATAPIVVGIETGGAPASWETIERSMRLVTAGVFGFGAALLPYLLPPKTWRAFKELRDIRAGATKDGFFVGIGVTF
jgi:hypothetical protein